MNNETKVNDINRVVQCNRSNDKPWLARIKRPIQYTYMAGMKCKWSRMNVAHAINYLPCGAIITRSRFPNRLTKSGGHLVSIMRLMSRLWSTLIAALLYSISFFFQTVLYRQPTWSYHHMLLGLHNDTKQMKINDLQYGVLYMIQKHQLKPGPEQL